MQRRVHSPYMTTTNNNEVKCKGCGVQGLKWGTPEGSKVRALFTVVGNTRHACAFGPYARKSRAYTPSRNVEGRRFAYSSVGYVGTGGRELDRSGEPS